VAGYRASIMSADVARSDLAAKPNDIRALAAFIQTRK
jgi:hypothetical protein